ncbi:MAG: toll/interleukin-1 receptor domain-containing protein [Rhodomicrobium sp.]
MTSAFPYDIFISYSQRDRAAAERIQAALASHDLKIWRDERLLDNPDSSFIGEINAALERSAKVLVLWSRNSVGSAWVQAEAEKARMAEKVVPLALDPIGALLPFIPTPFNILPTIDVSARNADLEPVLRALGAEQVAGAAPGVVSLAEAHVDLSKLPRTFAAKLYGRGREMAKLVAAWDGAATRIFAFDAMGGAGKTALVYHFVQALKASGWRGARSVFAWSFYSQGSNEDRQTSADDFFKAAFRHFGGPDAAPPRDPREKGVELAHLVQASRALLILDGMEPLQYAARGGGHSSTVAGGVKDPGVKALLALLADSNPGLCLVTTRIPLAELQGAHGVTFEALERLPLMAGIDLLRDLGVEPDFPPPPSSLRGAPPRSNPGATDESLDRQQARLGELGSLMVPNSQANSGADAPRDDGAAFALPRREEFAALVPPYAPPAEYAPPPPCALPALPARVAKDFIAAVEELKGHALALTLIGKSLAEDHRGDIRAVHDLPSLPHLHPSDPARDAYRVMRGIEIALARRIAEDGATAGPAKSAAGRQLALLFFLGLFDRPADTALLPAVFPLAAADYLQPDPDDPALAAKDLIQIKRSLRELKDERESGVPEWRLDEIAQEEAPLIAERDAIVEAGRRVLARRAFAGMAELTRDRRPIVEALRELARRGLIAAFDESAEFSRASIDCHPLVREYFGERLKELDRETFKAMHGRLYDHYRYAGLPPAFCDPVAYGVLALKAAFERDHYAYMKQRLMAGDMPDREREQLPPSIGFLRPEQLRNAFDLVEGTQWKSAKAVFLPENEAGMTPLFAAIAHGCAAEREDETWSEVYWPRIARGNENFAAAKLGLFGQELAALAAFFETPFTKPGPRLSPPRRALALNLAGFRLRALGRLEDAAEPMRAAVENYVDREDWKQASLNSGNLSELLLTIGRIAGEDGAVAAGERAVEFADRSGDDFQRMGKRTTHADALAQAGVLARAEALFRESEALQKEDQPNLPRLYSLQGYRYCDLLLARGRAAEAAARAAWALNKGQAGGYPLLSIALDTLTQARAALQSRHCEAEGRSNPGATDAALDRHGPCGPRDHVGESSPRDDEGAGRLAELSRQALAALRRANQEAYIVPGLLVHAEALWRRGDAKAANEPLREAETIAARGPMPLFMADAHLLRARIALSQGDLAAAKAKRDAALELIAKHSYGRAAPELALLTAEIARADNAANGEAAIAVAIAAIRSKPYHDERTSIAIDGGWWGLLPRLEALLPADDARLAELRDARDAYNAERDAYLAAEEADLQSKLAEEWEAEDRALADPDFRRQLSDILVANGYKFDDMLLEQRRQAARELLQHMRKAQQQESLPEIPDALVRHIFADPQAEEMLRDAMRQNNLPGEPADLPLETQRAIVAALMQQGVIQFADAPQADAAPAPEADPQTQPEGEWEAEDRALADPDFRRQLSDILKGGKIDLGALPQGDRREAARLVLQKMHEAQLQQEAPELPEIPDAAVRGIFADSQAQELLRDAMRQNGIPGAPADLPLEAQRAILAALVKAGAISLGEAPPPPEPGARKKRGWWPF